MPLLFVIPAPLLGLLALAGCAALLVRVGRALLRMGIAVLEKTAVGGMLEISVRRGDLTAMAERERYVKAMAAARVRAMAGLGIWTALLIIPPLAGVAAPVYAACVVLWLLPRRPLRLTSTRSPTSVDATPGTVEVTTGTLPPGAVEVMTGRPPATAEEQE